MPGFLYFIAGLSGSPGHKDLAALDLRYAFPKRVSIESAVGSEGPGGSGTIVAEADNRLVYKKDEQVWKQISERVWVGMWRDKRPRPDDLHSRDALIRGHQVQLGDGNHWVVPVIRFVNGDTSLPRVLKYESGRAVYLVRDEYSALFQMAREFLDKSLAGQGREIQPDQLLWFCTQVLQLNYRVSEHEISMLELIDSENVKNVADAALDGPNLVELLEEFKKKLAGVASAHGQDLKTGIAG